jgi:hypothetical protein
MENRKAILNNDQHFETEAPIPEGSQLDKYIKSCQAIFSKELTEETFQELDTFLRSVFGDIMTFLIPKGQTKLAIQLEIIYSNDEFKKIQESASKNPKIIQPPKAKIPINAFVLHNRVRATIYINYGGLSSLGNTTTFVLNYVACVGHEINHILYP